jgi:hypothetical protein
MSASTVTSQDSRPDLLVVILIHQALRIDAARLASALAALRPGDRPGRVAAIGAFYDQYLGQLAIAGLRRQNKLGLNLLRYSAVRLLHSEEQQ